MRHVNTVPAPETRSPRRVNLARVSRGRHNEGVTEMSSPDNRFVAAEAVAERLGVTVDEVTALIGRGEIRGIEVGEPPRWRVEDASVTAYIADRVERARRAALWRQSQEASFPELWGDGDIRHPD